MEKLPLLIQEMEKLCKEHNIQLVLVVAPNQGVLAGASEFVPDYKEMIQVLHNTGVAYIDMHNFLHQIDH
jgi:hypothetical protein